MDVRVLLFARARELAGSDSVHVTVDDGATLRDVAAALVAHAAELAPYLPSCRLALDEEFRDLDTPVADGAEVAVIPPVSGGT